LKSIWWGSPAANSHDLNGDGKPDLLVRVTSTGVMRLYTGDGVGGFTGSQTNGSGWQGMSSIMLPGDANGDGRPDVVAMRTSDGSLWLYPGTGSGWVSSG